MKSPELSIWDSAQRWKQWLKTKSGQSTLEGQHGPSNVPRSASKMWESSRRVERSELVLSARMLATQYGELQEVVKLCKSERLSESQCCLCKHHLNHNTLKISFFCSLPTQVPLILAKFIVHLIQGFLHIPCQVTPTWPQWESGCAVAAFY